MLAKVSLKFKLTLNQLKSNLNVIDCLLLIEHCPNIYPDKLWSIGLNFHASTLVVSTSGKYICTNTYEQSHDAVSYYLTPIFIMCGYYFTSQLHMSHASKLLSYLGSTYFTSAYHEYISKRGIGITRSSSSLLHLHGGGIIIRQITSPGIISISSHNQLCQVSYIASLISSNVL